MASRLGAATSEDFEVAWVHYPKRPNQNKRLAWKAWQARIREGTDPQAIIAGVLRYAAWVTKKHQDPEYILHAKTFFGPAAHWETEWVYQEPKKPQDFVPTYQDRYRPPQVKREPLTPGLLDSIRSAIA